MTDATKKHRTLKSIPWQTIGFVLLILLFAAMLLKSNFSKGQAMAPVGAHISFEGEYRIGEGEWMRIEPGEHISASKGDVTLRGRFQRLSPDGIYIGPASKGTPIALFLDHINVKIYESGQRPYTLYNEHPALGASACGEIWLTYVLTGETEEPIEIVIHNPHFYGNETAVDTLLSGIALWMGVDFEREALSDGGVQRTLGLLTCIGAVVLLGIALFSSLLHIRRSRLIWMLGAGSALAGAHLTYSAPGTYFWSEQIAINTTVIGASMMLYMLCSAAIMVSFFKRMQKLGNALLLVLGIADAIFMLLPLLTSVRFYDTWAIWAIVQSAANLILLGCTVREFISASKALRVGHIGMIFLLLAFEADVIATAIGIWKGGLASQYVYAALFLSALLVVLKIIPGNINSARKARELERERTELKAQLTESRVATMISQIRPHFIYNTLGSIEQLCEIDPKKAGELVHDFSKYLRGNFGELDNPRPISITREMAHVQHYVSIEKVRFPDMTFSFEMKSGEFYLPALTVQPIVENAIKHGLMKLSRGGSVSVVSYETDTHYCISVEDDGVGFDTSVSQDERTHVGLRNIRERLATMVGGTLTIESTVGVGTRVLIAIPKEEKK